MVLLLNMANYVPDIRTHRWVILSPQRFSRPEDETVGRKKRRVCVFCPGNEHLTPAEVLRFGPGEKDTPGWKVRVIPNKYPITDLHEVVVHTPESKKDIEDLPPLHVTLIFKAYRERYNFYRKRGHVMIFANHGSHAGASLSHPHSQLVVIPGQINLDTLTREPIKNIVSENKYFTTYCPDFSQWPYEIWIAPKKENTYFGDIDDIEIESLVVIVQKILKKLEHLYQKHKISNLPFGYNYYIYPRENWYLRIIPRFVHRAGFELGTGLSVNIIDPREAVEAFRER